MSNTEHECPGHPHICEVCYRICGRCGGTGIKEDPETVENFNHTTSCLRCHGKGHVGDRLPLEMEHILKQDKRMLEGVRSTPSSTLDDHYEAFAFVLASYAHKYQRYGTEPYTVHLQAVRDILVEHGHTHLAAAGWLHDILEDTDVTTAELYLCFPTHIVETVVAVTGKGKGRKAKLESIIPLLATNEDARILKAADRLANVRACINDMDAPDPFEERFPRHQSRSPYSAENIGSDLVYPSPSSNGRSLYTMYKEEWPTVRPHLLNADDTILASLDELLAPPFPNHLRD